MLTNSYMESKEL